MRGRRWGGSHGSVDQFGRPEGGSVWAPIDIEAVANDKVLETAIRKALMDAPRPGAPPQFTEDQVNMVCAMACRSPSDYGLPHTQWTRGLLARIAVEKGIVSSVSVAEIGRWLKKGG